MRSSRSWPTSLRGVRAEDSCCAQVSSSAPRREFFLIRPLRSYANSGPSSLARRRMMVLEEHAPVQPKSRFTKRGEHGAHICVKIRMPCKPLAPTPRRPPSCFRMSPLYLPFWKLQHAGVRRVAGHPPPATPRPSTPPPALLWSHRHHRERLPGATLAASSTRRERSWCCSWCGAWAPRWAAKPEPSSLRYAWPLPARDVSLAYLACRRLLRRGAEGRGDASRQTMLAPAPPPRNDVHDPRPGLHGAASVRRRAAGNVPGEAV